MNVLKLTIITLALILSTNANSALIERMGGLAYYDDIANLTWLTDANYAQTSGHDSDGRMTWQQSMDWVAGLSVGGVDGWRLANTIDVGNDAATFTNRYEGVDYGYNITTHSELSNMYYNVLGNTAYYDTSGTLTGCAEYPDYCLTNRGPFSNLQAGYYWSATETWPYAGSAWLFSMNYGVQTHLSQDLIRYAWAVQSGDVGVSAVPVPAAAWLFGSGLIGLIGIAKRKKV